jgi:hypothetical protein
VAARIAQNLSEQIAAIGDADSDPKKQDHDAYLT